MRIGPLLVTMMLIASPCFSAVPATPEQYRRIADQVEASLFRDDLNKWFAAAIDQKNGGFVENFRYDWSPGRTGVKSIVYQSRLTWLSAAAAMRFPKDADRYRAISQHGVEALSRKMWDA